MKLAIMQPYFFPYIGYFQLIAAADRFILFDDVQYIRHGWINRNRVLKPEGEGFTYVSVPLEKHDSKTLIREIRTANDAAWKARIIRQLDHYKKKAPYYKPVHELLRTCLSNTETNITLFNGGCLKTTCAYLGIDFTIEVSSAMNLDYSQVHGPGQWALRICEQVGAREYINPSGGREIFDEEEYDASDIRLRFLKPDIRPYDQRRLFFEPNLSMIDIMMFNSAMEIKEMLSAYTFV